VCTVVSAFVGVQLFSVRAFIQLEYCPIPSVVHTGGMTMYVHLAHSPGKLVPVVQQEIGYTRAFFPSIPRRCCLKRPFPSLPFAPQTLHRRPLQNDERGVYKNSSSRSYICNPVNTEDEGETAGGSVCIALSMDKGRVENVGK
jgi:hypothetical protein